MTNGVDQTMAKLQKSLLLHEGLCRIIEAEQARSGSNFTRLCTAAIMRFLFSDLLDSDNELWMQLAWNVEKGNVSLGDVPLKAFETLLKLDLEREKIATKNGDEETAAVARYAIERISEAINGWNAIRQLSDDPIDAFVAHKGRPRTAVVPDDDGGGDNPSYEQLQSNVRVLEWALRNAKVHGGTPDEIAFLEQEITATNELLGRK